MDFIMSSIISGVIYDLISKGVRVTFANVFGNFNNSINLEDVRDLLDEINSNITNIKTEKDVTNIVESKTGYIDIINQLTYNTRFAERLDYVMCLMNPSVGNDRLNIDSLSRWLGFDSSNVIKKYYSGNIEPSFEFEKIVGEKMGVNVEWIQTGNNAPFRSVLSHRFLEQNDLKDVKEFLFISSTERSIFIVEKYDKYKYLLIPYSFVFNSHVGATGASGLFSLYSALKKLREDGYQIDDGIYEISRPDFDDLENGNRYPLEYIKKGEHINYIIDDFLDLYSSETEKQDYISHYGNDFVKVQDIVKRIQNMT